MHLGILPLPSPAATELRSALELLMCLMSVPITAIILVLLQSSRNHSTHSNAACCNAAMGVTADELVGVDYVVSCPELMIDNVAEANKDRKEVKVDEGNS